MSTPGRRPRIAPAPRRLAPAAALALLVAGCAHGRADRLRCSAQGGPAWREYESAHFTVDTDAAPPVAAELVARLETLHALLVRALFDEPRDLPGRVRVVALRDARQFAAIAGDDHVSGYSGPGQLGEPTVVLRVGDRGVDGEVVAHELAHPLSFFAVPRQPRWFSEGLATFVESVGDERQRPGAVGLATRRVRQALASAPRVAIRDVLDWREMRDPGGYHVWSWLLFHWLADERPKGLDAFRHRLVRGDDPAVAWRIAFPEYDPGREGALAGLQHALEGYRRAGAFASWTVSAAGDPRHTEAPLAPADVHMLLLQVRAGWPEHKDERRRLARAEIEEALREDPSQPMAHAALAELDGTSAIQELGADVEARPDDWRAWLLLASAREAAGERAAGVAAYRRAVALHPDSARAQGGLAWALANEGLGEAALPFARRAVALAPWDPLALDALAFVDAGLGHCPEALQLQRRVLDLALAQPPGRGPDLDGVRSRLRAYEAGCGDDALTGGASLGSAEGP